MLRTLRLVPVMVTQDLGFSDKAYRVQQQLSPPGSSPGHFRQTKEHVWSSSSTDSQFVSCRARVGRRFRGGRGGGGATPLAGPEPCPLKEARLALCWRARATLEASCVFWSAGRSSERFPGEVGDPCGFRGRSRKIDFRT